LTFNAKHLAAIKRWINRAAPLKGLFFRSVEYRYMDPLDVLSGPERGLTAEDLLLSVPARFTCL